MTEAVYHAIATTKTWCGLEVVTTEEGGPERPVPLIAPDRTSVTCADCLAAMPVAPRHVFAAAVVKDRMEAEAKRWAKREGAPPEEKEAGIDPAEVARKVKEQL